MKYWEIIAGNLKQAGWNCGCISSTDDEGRQFWVVAAEREGVGRFIVRADKKLTAFVELEAAIRPTTDQPATPLPDESPRPRDQTMSFSASSGSVSDSLSENSNGKHVTNLVATF
jgi:hypothetical protein